MVLIVALLAVTSTLALSSQRTTTDQRFTLQAQYAAESGLSRAKSKLSETETVLKTLSVRANIRSNNVSAHAKHFCGTNTLNPVPESWTPEQHREGIQLCKAAPVTSNSRERFSLFTAYTPSDAYPRGVSPSQYWREVFDSSNPIETRLVADPETGAETWYRASFGLVPRAVRLMGVDNYRFEFEVSPVVSVGEVRVNGEVIATRTVGLETPGSFDVSIGRPSFSRYVLFRNNTRSTGGNQLFFAGGERFDGPVHTNGTPRFARLNADVPQFFGTFSTAARRASHYGVSERDYSAIFRGDPGCFSVDAVPLPANNNNQLRASFGGDAADSREVGASELTSAWNVPKMSNGIYYSRGDGNDANREDNWAGGLYIRGDVSDLTLSTRRGQQVIRITREEVVGERTERRWVYSGRRQRWEKRDVTVPVTETRITTLEQTRDNTWTVDEDGRSRTLSGTFNGMIYVDGDIESLGGDSTAAADIAAKSQLTLTTIGNITVKRSLTYTNNPREGENALNVLGLFTAGGSVLLDGPRRQDLNVHATVMASARGEGFGTVDPDGFRGYVSSRKARINLLGGVIEDQSQMVGNLGTGGYERNYVYDPRFAEGFAPPYFPTQTNWDSSAETFSRERGLWEVSR